jgi:hypothetical protein
MMLVRLGASSAVLMCINSIMQRIKISFFRIEESIMSITAIKRFIGLRIDRLRDMEPIDRGMKKLLQLKEDALFAELKHQPTGRNSSMSTITIIAAPRKRRHAINADVAFCVVGAIQLLSEWKLYPTGQRMLYPILESTGWN